MALNRPVPTDFWINPKVNKVYLYKDRATIIFNINNQIEEVDVSLLDDVESLLLNAKALPFGIKTLT